MHAHAKVGGQTYLSVSSCSLGTASRGTARTDKLELQSSDRDMGDTNSPVRYAGSAAEAVAHGCRSRLSPGSWHARPAKGQGRLLSSPEYIPTVHPRTRDISYVSLYVSFLSRTYYLSLPIWNIAL